MGMPKNQGHLMHRSLSIRSRTLAAALVVVVGTLSLSACEPAADTYVALGDSAAAGPLIADQVGGDELGCWRSTNNYPALTRPRIKATKLVDATCSSALTNHFFSPQPVDVGTTRPAQMTRLDRQTKVVTIHYGGNDIGFGDILQSCIQLNPFGPGCTSTYVHDGRDILRERITALGPKMDAVIVEAKRRAPRAQIFIVGYLTPLPDTGTGCWSPLVPILPADVPYLRGIHKGLNAKLKERALANGVHYVDIATPSIGHDLCSSDRWLEPLIPNPGAFAFPVHPNIHGMRAVSNILTTQINSVVTA